MGNSLKDLLVWHGSNKELLRSLRMNAESRAMGQLRMLTDQMVNSSFQGAKTLAYRAGRVRGGTVLLWAKVALGNGKKMTFRVVRNSDNTVLQTTFKQGTAVAVTSYIWLALPCPTNEDVRLEVVLEDATCFLYQSQLWETCGTPASGESGIFLGSAPDPDGGWRGPFWPYPDAQYSPAVPEKVWRPDEIPTETNLDKQIATLPKCSLIYASPPGVQWSETSTSFQDKFEVRVRPFLGSYVHVHAYLEQTGNGVLMQVRIKDTLGNSDLLMTLQELINSGVQEKYGNSIINAGGTTGDMIGKDGSILIRLSTNSGAAPAYIREVRVYQSMGTPDIWR